MRTKLNIFTLLVISAGIANVSAEEKAGVITTESGVDFIPALNAGLKYDDNIASRSTNEEESWILTVAPAVQAKMLDGNNIYTIDAGIEYGDYFDSSDDNYLDALLKARAQVELNQSNRFNLEAKYFYGHEDRGTGVFDFGFDDGLPTEPATYDIFQGGGYYEYGAKSTPARVRINGLYDSKEYTNFKELTQFRNKDNVKLGATVFYDTRAATSIFLDYQYIQTAYDVMDPGGDRDSDTQNLQLGVEWEATSTTEGSIRIGYQKKAFDNQEREDFSGVAWDAKLTWKPLTYSQFDFYTGRSSEDPDTFGDYVRETTYGVKWSHDWSDLFGTTLGYDRIQDDYTGFEREDTTNVYRVSFNFEVLRWMTLRAGADIADNTSIQERFDYDRNIYFITAEMTL
ncbi:outer membrane beta-barrel protein [Pseudomonadota bacterium]